MLMILRLWLRQMKVTTRGRMGLRAGDGGDSGGLNDGGAGALVGNVTLAPTAADGRGGGRRAPASGGGLPITCCEEGAPSSAHGRGRSLFVLIFFFPLSFAGLALSSSKA